MLFDALPVPPGGTVIHYKSTPLLPLMAAPPAASTLPSLHPALSKVHIEKCAPPEGESPDICSVSLAFARECCPCSARRRGSSVLLSTALAPRSCSCAAAPILVGVLVARIPARSKSTRKGHD